MIITPRAWNLTLSRDEGSITEPHVGHLAVTFWEILRMRGEEGLLVVNSDVAFQSSQGCLMFHFVGRLGTIVFDLKKVTIC